jgi:hypothetical protein
MSFDENRRCTGNHKNYQSSHLSASTRKSVFSSQNSTVFIRSHQNCVNVLEPWLKALGSTPEPSGNESSLNNIPQFMQRRKNCPGKLGFQSRV